jgi:hypothetical protein
MILSYNPLKTLELSPQLRSLSHLELTATALTQVQGLVGLSTVQYVMLDGLQPRQKATAFQRQSGTTFDLTPDTGSKLDLTRYTVFNVNGMDAPVKIAVSQLNSDALSLGLGFSQPYSFKLDMMPHWPNLATLNLTNADLRNFQVPDLGSWLQTYMPKLAVLSVGGDRICADIELKYTFSCSPSLQRLEIVSSVCASIRVSGNCSALHTISINGNPDLTDIDFSAASGVSLRRLDLSHNPSLRNVSVFPRSAILNIGDTSLPFNAAFCVTSGYESFLGSNMAALESYASTDTELFRLLDACAQINVFDFSENAVSTSPNILSMFYHKPLMLRNDLNAHGFTENQIVMYNLAAKGLQVTVVDRFPTLQLSPGPLFCKFTEEFLPLTGNSSINPPYVPIYYLDCSCSTGYEANSRTGSCESIKPEMSTWVKVLLGAFAFISVATWQYARFQVRFARVGVVVKQLADDKDKLERAWLIDSTDLTFGKQIGAGGFGDVYHVHYQQPLCAKVLHAGASNDLDAFQQEVYFLKRTRHANLVRFYGAGQLSGEQLDGGGTDSMSDIRPFLVLEFADQGSLESVLGRDSEPAWELRLALMRDAARGVAYIHLQDGGRAMHRDLKPDNVLVFSTPNGVVGKVTDFGTVKMIQLSTTQRHHHTHQAETASARLIIQQQLDQVSAGHAVTVGAVGTIVYMAPEILRADSAYTQAIDVFSMGVMLWQVATLAPPNLLAMHGKCRGPPATGQSKLLEAGIRLPLDQLAEQWYRTLVDQCFAYDPLARPLMQRVGEVLDEHLYMYT